MANQMIALQTRNPQLPDPSRAAAQYANMMNMASQQRATQLQGERTRQEMDYARASEGRAAQTQTAAMRKADQDYQIANMTRLRNIGLSVLESGNEEAYQDLVGLITASDPDFGRIVKRVAPTLAANPNAVRYIIDEASAYLSKNTPQRTSTGEFDAKGDLVLMDLGGDKPPRIRSGVATEDPYIPPAKTTAAPPVTPSPIPVGKYGETRVAPDGGPLTPDLQESLRKMKEGLGMTNTPASFNSGSMSTPTAGQMTPDMVPAILDSAVKTGVMAQIDLDQMLALAPVQARDGIMDVIRSNNIALQADAPSLAASGMGQQPPMAVNPVQRPDSTYANLPPRQLQDNQPMMQNTLAQYKVGEQIKGKNPSMSPYPGSAQVPIERVRAEGVAGRASPAETAANEAAKIDVQTKAKIAEEDRIKAKGRKLFSSVLNDLRNDYQKLNRMEAIPSIERGGFENVGDYFGASRVGRMAQSAVGARASVPLNTISNSKLTLMNALKEATGLSATQLSSNIELMTFLDSLADPTQGFESAMETIRRLDNLYGAPAATATAATAAPRAAAKTPVIPDAAKQMLRKNPSPQQRAFFDRTFGKGAAAKVMGNR